jgi:hypothetical protein
MMIIIIGNMIGGGGYSPGGGIAPVYGPSFDFSDFRNSQYISLI